MTTHNNGQQEYQRQLAHIHELDSESLFAGCQSLCGWLTDGDPQNEPHKHKQACPRCGGDDRFRYSPDFKRFFCNQCKPTGGWDGIALIEEFADGGKASHREAVRLLAEATGYDPSATLIGQVKQSSAPKQRTVYVVSASDVAVPVADLLSKQVSLYPHCETNTPSGTATIGDVLQSFRVGGKFIPQIEAIRNEPDKDKRKALKRRTPAVVLGSEPQEIRYATTCVPNGMLMVDCDSIEADKMESVRQAIMELLYVITTCLSVSGRGLCTLVAYEGTDDVKQLLTALQNDFPCELDMSCSDISRLRIVTHDPDMVIKDVVYPAVLTEQTESVMDDLEYVPFPLDKLPSTLAEFVRDTQSCINLKDPAMPAISVLAVIASVIGSSCRIEIKRGYTEPAALFAAIVADSGLAKTPSVAAATSRLKALESEKHRQWKQARHEWSRVSSTWKRLPKADQGSEPEEPPPATRFLINDVTLEAVARVLGENPCGVLLSGSMLCSPVNRRTVS